MLALLTFFFGKASTDARIGIAHIGLYASLLQMWSEQGMDGPIKAYAAQVMICAKISSCATYHKLIRDLAAYGIIEYRPSFFKDTASEIFILSH